VGDRGRVDADRRPGVAGPGAQRADRELLGLGGPVDYQHTVATTWTVALERVRAQAPAAEDLLGLCAFLAPENLPCTLLSGHADQLPDRLQQAAGDRFAFDQTLGALGRYSLVTASEHHPGRAPAGPDRRPRGPRSGDGAGLGGAAGAGRLPPRQSNDVRSWPVCAS